MTPLATENAGKRILERPGGIPRPALSGKGRRAKGGDGEREIANLLSDLLGIPIKRRVRQHEGDSDLEGLLGWSVEVERAKTATLPSWWRQACAQAKGALPVLFYRLDGKKWRAIWPLSVVVGVIDQPWCDLSMTAETTVGGWAAVYRELLATQESGPLSLPALKAGVSRGEIDE